MLGSDAFSLDRRSLTLGLLGSLTATSGWSQAVTPTSLMTACHDTTRFSNARFVAALTQQNRTGPIKKRDLDADETAYLSVRTPALFLMDLTNSLPPSDKPALTPEQSLAQWRKLAWVDAQLP